MASIIYIYVNIYICLCHGRVSKASNRKHESIKHQCCHQRFILDTFVSEDLQGMFKPVVCCCPCCCSLPVSNDMSLTISYAPASGILLLSNPYFVTTMSTRETISRKCTRTLLNRLSTQRYVAHISGQRSTTLYLCIILNIQRHSLHSSPSHRGLQESLSVH